MPQTYSINLTQLVLKTFFFENNKTKSENKINISNHIASLILKKNKLNSVLKKRKRFFLPPPFFYQEASSLLFFYIIQSLFKQATSIPSLLNSENISPLRSGSEKQDTLQYTTFSPPLISYTQNAL